MRATFVAAFAAALISASQVDAAVLLRVQELASPGILIRVSGSLDLTGLGSPDALFLDETSGPLVTPNRGYIAAGVTSFVDIYRGAFANPVDAFGSGGAADHWSVASGDSDTFFAIAMAENALLLPAGYRSGDAIDAFTSYVGAPGFTLASVGLGLGSYDFDLVNGDRVTVRIAPAPLPATLPLIFAGLAGLAVAAGAAKRPGRGGRLA
jgi:hypothetical protein